MQTQHIRTASRIAYLNAAAAQSPETWTIHGTALGADEVTNGAVNGEPQQVEWPSAVLEAASATLEDKPLIDVHSGDDDGDIEFPPPAEITVGTVDRVGFDPGVGILYEATLADEDLAQKIEAGILTVSPEIRFGAEQREDGVLRATDAAFYGLAVVSVGGSDAASAAAGPNEALAQATLSALGVEALLDDSPLAPDDPGTDSSEGEVANDGTGAETTGAATEGGSDSPADTDDSSDHDMSDDDTDDDAGLEDIDLEGRIVIDEERHAELTAAESELETLSEETDDLESELEAKQEEVEAVRDVYAAELADNTGHSAAFYDDTDVGSLKAELASVLDVEEDEAAEAALGGGGGQPQTGDGGGDTPANLDDDDREEIESMLGRAEMLEGADAEYATELREEAAEAAGVDDPAEIEEVL